MDVLWTTKVILSVCSSAFGRRFANGSVCAEQAAGYYVPLIKIFYA